MLNQDYKEILQFLQEEKAEFIIVGAYALAAHGYPRATADIDIWILPSPENAEKVYRAIVKFGAPVHDLTKDDFKVKDMVFQIGVAPRRIDILTSISGVTFQEANNDVVMLTIDDMKLPFISLENLIRNKEATGRLKDMADAENLRKHISSR